MLSSWINISIAIVTLSIAAKVSININKERWANAFESQNPAARLIYYIEHFRSQLYL